MLKHALVVTSIAPPTLLLKALADGAFSAGWRFYLIGDEKTPYEKYTGQWHDYYIGVDRQSDYELETVTALPLSNYSRKNIGYLLAMRDGADVIVETDDDNRPLESFWCSRQESHSVPFLLWDGWVNMLMQFTDTDDLIWPRGFPLECLSLYSDALPINASDYGRQLRPFCPIQQSLIGDEPDVDAIYRLTQNYQSHGFCDKRMAVVKGWCPFNSQNTTWFKEAFPLLYIPSYCKDAYRMDDIWRSFIAQRIAFENGWAILWGGMTVSQERNPHDLLKDFEQEIPGYLYNRKIVEYLKALPIQKGVEHLYDNLRVCYQMMVERGFIGSAELPLLECWIRDCRLVLG
jgi:hypothetical protein